MSQKSVSKKQPTQRTQTSKIKPNDPRVEAVAEANIKKNNLPLKDFEKATGSISRAEWEKFSTPWTKTKETITITTMNKTIATNITIATNKTIATNESVINKNKTSTQIMTKEALSSTSFKLAINGRINNPTARIKKVMSTKTKTKIYLK